MAQRVGTAVTGAGDTAASSIAASAKSTTGGNALAVHVKWEQTSTTLSSITDTAGNTFQIVAQGVHGNGLLRSAIAFATNIVGNASNVVTANFSSASPNWRRIQVEEFSGLAAATVADASASSSGSGTSYSTGALSTAGPGVVFAGVGGYTSLTGVTAGGTPASSLGGTNSDTFNTYLISNQAQSVTPGASANESNDWIMRAIALLDVVAVPTYSVDRPWLDEVMASGGLQNAELRDARAWF